MEADISIWRKPGHFYFALTRTPITLSATFEFKLPSGSTLTEYTALPPAESEMLCEVGEA